MNEQAEVETVKQVALSFPDRARQIVIETPEHYSAAAGFLKEIKACRKRIADVFGPIVKAAHEAHKRAKAAQTEADDPLDQAEGLIKGAMVSYDTRQAEVASQRQIEAEAAARRAEEQRVIDQAVALEQAGEVEAAQELIAAPVVAPVVMVESATPTVEGISIRAVWQFQVTDPNLVPREWLIVDEKKVGAYVRAVKAQAFIPGIKVFPVRSMSARAG
jgi:hypothetical protein